MLSNTHSKAKIYTSCLLTEEVSFIARDWDPNFHLNTETNLQAKSVTDDTQVCIASNQRPRPHACTWAQAHAVAVSEEKAGAQLLLLLGQTSFPHRGNPGHEAGEVTDLNKGHV